MRLTPCYDVITKQDCPDRKTGCSSNCERWAEYVKARNKDYLNRKAISQANSVVHTHRTIDNLKHKQRLERRTRR